MQGIIFVLILLSPQIIFSQMLAVYQIKSINHLSIDGQLTETEWINTDSITLRMVEPAEGEIPHFPTVIKILADKSSIVLGIKCYDSEPAKIISFSKSRDALLDTEDRIKFVFDTFLDNRSGYIFAVNPDGTRYDALVSDFGEHENPDWDGNWIAESSIDSSGWSTEILIPIKTLVFSSNINEWGFNIERRNQRYLELDRWTGIKRDYQLSQVVHAGRMTNLPDFDMGLGMIIKPSLITRTTKQNTAKEISKLDVSFDLTQRINSEITGQLTIYTDFAETEVDVRQSNLTRFPLFFPEKRGFFLEGTDIFDFGIGLGTDVIPFFSRRIGLYQGEKIPIYIGGKINGKVDKTYFGALVTRTGNVEETTPSPTMGVFRIKQNILEESSIGIIGTFGDPLGRKNIWLAGGDFIFQTSKFMDNKNFLIGAWGLYNNNPNLAGDKSSIGLKADYPNDLWDIAVTVKRIGDAFEPSLGFVPRKGVVMYSLGADYMPRPGWFNIRQFFFETSSSLVTNLQNEWESWRIFTAPVHFLLESGDRFEFNIAPEGDNLPEDFEIENGVIIKKGPYDWFRYRLEFESASKRVINGMATYWFGSFYDGRLDQLILDLNFRPFSSLNLGINYERNIGSLSAGSFDQNLWGGRLQYSFTPDFDFSSFLQYDNMSKSLGTNSRLRWTFSMLGDLFIVYNHNIHNYTERYWQFESNQLIIKVTYGLWY